MKLTPTTLTASLSLLLLTNSSALAALPMGLKCEPKIKIAGADLGEIGTYEVQKGMVKEEHRALLKRKKVAPVDGCNFTDISPGQTLVVRYSGEEASDLDVQCIDLNNSNAAVVFPKSIYTVRNSDISSWMLMPFCPDGVSKDGFPCSKLGSQSERGSEYKDTVLKWKANDPKTKLFKVDLQFDAPYKSRVPPFASSVPSNAKLFCGLINKAGNVVIAGTAQYPAIVAEAEAAPTPSSSPSSQSARPRSR